MPAKPRRPILICLLCLGASNAAAQDSFRSAYCKASKAAYYYDYSGAQPAKEMKISDYDDAFAGGGVYRFTFGDKGYVVNGGKFTVVASHPGSVIIASAGSNGIGASLTSYAINFQAQKIIRSHLNTSNNFVLDDHALRSRIVELECEFFR